MATTRRIADATREIAEGIAEIDGIELVGRADVCVVAFGPSAAPAGSGEKPINVYAIADCMKATRDWDLATLQNPPAVHLALTLATARNARLFVQDLRAAVAAVRDDAGGKYKSTAGIYGMAASLPTEFIEDTVKIYLDTMTMCPGEHTGRDEEPAASA